MEFVIRYLFALVGVLFWVFLDSKLSKFAEPSNSEVVRKGYDVPVPLSPEQIKKREKKMVLFILLFPLVITLLDYFVW
ncbi:hypothetical protein QTG56_25475 (plasmid) [Rossellomorea sp. AcN35-11]|nr:hypothetical protein [Rossellomorea aquimaris]WJV31967.1 hypothetical protein QTG56_25475 [Rossellomorea sp. AcN35-11]